ncbi:hypothetical protein DFH08DRAFT_205701 [Mycena albidolilacea]|uniref:Uncharacterized protein n=1 Tax=Mycena albidolilacea TaxID=1033008 RepID=A0AAD7A044_9AGAR|nr:hypothetical protein DFH08DRAFT_205701 [Mycena albidolilacea]
MVSSTSTMGLTILYLTVGLVVQTLFFGAYTVIIALSARMLMRRGLKAPANRVLMILTVFMYLLSAAYWVFRIADLVSRIQFVEDHPQLTAVTPVTRFLALFNALMLIIVGILFVARIPLNLDSQYLLCDGVVIWRARLVCSQGHRKYMYLPLFFLVLTTLAVVGVIGLRILSISIRGFGKAPFFTSAVNILQVSAINTSLISNLSSTGVVGIATWQHREAIRDGFNKTTKGNRILSILLESGLLYCIAELLVLAFTFIRLPYNDTLGDFFTPVNVQIAGAYTPIVLLLVNTQKSLNETSFLGTIPDANPMPQIKEIPTEAVRESTQFGTPPTPSDADVGLQTRKGHQYNLSGATLV